jgi:hypothetical protein
LWLLPGMALDKFFINQPEYCRIVWDIFPEDKNIRFVVAGAQPELLNGWQVL